MNGLTNGNKVILMLIFTLVFLFSSLYADGYFTNRKGIKAYKEKKYDEAVKHFAAALEEEPNKDEIYYNLGSAYIQSQTPQEAEKFLQRALKSDDPSLREKAYYNLGNAYFRQQQYDKSLEAYKKALLLNPSNKEAKINYELALRKRNEQNQQKPQQNQNNQNKQDNQDNQQNQNQNQQNSKQDENQQSQKGNQNQEQPEIDKQTAEQILNALREKEKEVQKDLQKTKGRAVRGQKEW